MESGIQYIEVLIDVTTTDADEITDSETISKLNNVFNNGKPCFLKAHIYTGELNVPMDISGFATYARAGQLLSLIEISSSTVQVYIVFEEGKYLATFNSEW